MDRPPLPTRRSRAHLHWLTAVLVIGLITVGILMGNMLTVGPLQDRLYNLHRSTGVLLLPLVIIRLCYRWTHPPLPLPADVPAFQRLAAESEHWGLYTLLIVQPLVGWAATSAYRAPIIVYGLFELPPILPVNQPLFGTALRTPPLARFPDGGDGLRPRRRGAVSSLHPRDRVLMRMVRRRLKHGASVRCDFGNDARTPPNSSFRQFVNAALTMKPAADAAEQPFHRLYSLAGVSRNTGFGWRSSRAPDRRAGRCAWRSRSTHFSS